jgi:PAS domain S-box-containing protein
MPDISNTSKWRGERSVLRILLVDDEPALLELAARYLQMPTPVETLTAESVKTALHILARGNIDAIVSDYEMPGTDGIMFLKMLRSQGNSIPFIIFTGKGRELVAMEALNFGADFYLQKGGDPAAEFAELRNMIEKAVERRTAVEETQALAERIEHQAQILDEILSSIPDPILIFDSDGYITYANMTGAKVMGYSRMMILGKHFRELRVPAATITALMKAGEKIFLTGEVQTSEVSVGEGKEKNQYMCSFSPLHTTTGRINAADVIFHDITNEKRISEELQQCRSQVSILSGKKGAGPDNRKE